MKAIMTDAVLQLKNFIGIAQKAGKVVSGDNNVLDALAKGEVKLIIIASDAAASVQKELEQANIAAVPTITFLNKLNLGWIIGKSPRGMIAICDDGFAAAIITKFNVLN